MTGTWARRAPLTGVVAVLLFIVSGVVGGEPPDFDATGDEVIAFYTEEEDSQTLSSILGAYGALFLIFFGGALRSALRRSERESGGLSAVAFGGVLVLALGILIFAGLSFTLADANDALDPAAAQALNALNGDFFFPVAVGTTAFLLSAGLAMVKADPLPSWLGWIAIVIGVIGITPIGFFAFLAGGIWIAVAGIVLATRPVASEVGSPPPD